MICKRNRTAIFFMAVLAGLAGGARADVVSAGCANALISASGGDYLGQSTCNTFDGNLGTLTDVKVHYLASISAEIDNQSSKLLIASVLGQFSFQGLPPVLPSRSGIMSSATVGVSAGHAGGPATSAHFDVDLAVLAIPQASDFFMGPLRTFSLQGQINRYQLDVTALAAGWVVTSETGLAQVTIDYIYTAAATAPNSVPEPASLSLLALSLGALGIARRNRASQPADAASTPS